MNKHRGNWNNARKSLSTMALSALALGVGEVTVVGMPVRSEGT